MWMSGTIAEHRHSTAIPPWFQMLLYVSGTQLAGKSQRMHYSRTGDNDLPVSSGPVKETSMQCYRMLRKGFEKCQWSTKGPGHVPLMRACRNLFKWLENLLLSVICRGSA